MYAIINMGKGKSYTSTVYAYYTDNENEEGADWWSRYYVVLNESKNALIKHYEFDADTEPYIHKMILITDNNQENWKVDERTGYGEIDIVQKQELLEMAARGTVSDELLCMDKDYKFEAYPEINNENDIKKLMMVSGGFHDAYIENIEEINGILYVMFAGIWGGKIEMWFGGDIEYDVSSVNPEEYDPYWFGSTMILENGFIYFVNGEDMEVEKIGEGYCWFKARKVKYHVIPD